MPGPLPRSTLIPALGNRLVVCTYEASGVPPNAFGIP
ncbi:Uncharacterised protein [Mycobacteroides abscessus subsp. abscessus]|nr:Uncharacterised protein [Mycobacteroides abscessus subsp. abscessus]